jgi:NAD(P)-dependent dehydrogenase (short-subunit alcohol dehydrogenase family)
MKARWTIDDVPGQHGRLAVVIGANTGLGFETARVLAARGASVVLACGTPRRASAPPSSPRANGP